jgi:NitT/TauT family transport system substrate-binding protein
MPDIVFQLVARAQGLDPRRDFELNHVASPMDAMQLLLARRIDHALIAEPAASMALHKSGSFPLSVVAPELHRALDLQREWGRVFDRPPRMPQAGIAVLGALRDDDDAVARIHAAYADALAGCLAEAREELDFFCRQLHAAQPALVGGRLPDARFYGARG